MRKALKALVLGMAVMACGAPLKADAKVVYEFSDANGVSKIQVVEGKETTVKEGEFKYLYPFKALKGPALIKDGTVYIPYFSVKGGKLSINPRSLVQVKPVYRHLSKEAADRVKKLVSLMESYGIKPEGQGKDLLVVLASPTCPFCKEHANAENIAKMEKKFKLLIVPVPVHAGDEKRVPLFLLYEKRYGMTKGVERFYSHWHLEKVQQASPKERAAVYGQVSADFERWQEQESKANAGQLPTDLAEKIKSLTKGLIVGTPEFILLRQNGEALIGVGRPPVGDYVVFGQFPFKRK